MEFPPEIKLTNSQVVELSDQGHECEVLAKTIWDTRGKKEEDPFLELFAAAMYWRINLPRAPHLPAMNTIIGKLKKIGELIGEALASDD